MTIDTWIQRFNLSHLINRMMKKKEKNIPILSLICGSQNRLFCKILYIASIKYFCCFDSLSLFLFLYCLFAYSLFIIRWRSPVYYVESQRQFNRIARPVYRIRITKQKKNIQFSPWIQTTATTEKKIKKKMERKTNIENNV